MVCQPNGSIDALGTDAEIDAPDAYQPFCFGATGLVKPCFMVAPTGDVTLPATINTDTSTLCSMTVIDVDGFCVIAGQRILVESAVAVTGTKPLVLAADGTIEISATLDVASHRGPTAPYATVKTGPGADPPAGCNAGVPPGNSGGGAGGSLGGSGGAGGSSGAGGSGGVSGSLFPITALRGGCPGQNGNSGIFGQGGHGGGAVYLIANTAINISGTGSLNASGEGGHPGITGNAGGGGGGSGGLIGLDSPIINNGGVVFANGASGGEGSGNMTSGNPGPEPTSTAASPAPPSGTGNGGDGGPGSGGSTIGGGPGMMGNISGGGGGAGGGIGVIRLFRGTFTGAGTHSPEPS